jgi:hypothetical protein
MRAPPLAITAEDGRVLAFDAVETITYSPSVRVTSHPIETGATVSDHAIREPMPLLASALMTASPLAGMLPLAGIASGGKARLDATVAFLRSIETRPITITTARGVFYPCFLTRWRHSDTKRQALKFDLAFQVVAFATSEEVTIDVPDPAPTEAASATASTDAGEQATVDTGDGSGTATAEEEGDQSALAAIYDAVEGE